MGSRKHLDNPKKHVAHKTEDITRINFGASKMGPGEYFNEFNISIITPSQDHYIKLTRADAEAMLKFFAETFNEKIKI